MTSLTEGEGPRALVVGTGLIGGSIALALRRRGWHVTGTDADTQRLAEALRSGVVDQAGDDLDAGVIFIAVPAASVADEARRILATPGRRPDAVVTDVSGVKTAIVEAADHSRFIGGHPMAGSEQVGLRGADPDLFEGAVWVLTPTAETDLDAFTILQGVVTALGADVLVLSAPDHDRLVAVVSHVPHLVAATLMNAAATGAEQNGSLLRAGRSRRAKGHKEDVHHQHVDEIHGLVQDHDIHNEMRNIAYRTQACGVPVHNHCSAKQQRQNHSHFVNLE